MVLHRLGGIQAGFYWSVMGQGNIRKLKKMQGF